MMPSRAAHVGQPAPATSAAVEQHRATIDCLAHYAARHLEDATSDDPELRRRYGRLVGLLAEHAAKAYAPLLTR